MGKRIEYIDLAKGICMIMVIILHIGGIGIERDIYIEAFWLFMLPLFFILSGYFFSASSGFKSFVWKKTKTLLFPYLIFSFPVFLYNILYYYSHTFSWEYVLQNSSIHNHPLWFVFSLYLMSICFYLLYTYINKYNVLIIIIIILSFLGVYLRRFNIDIKYTNSLEYMVYFYIGYYWRIKGDESIIQNRTVNLAIIIIFFCIAIPYQLNDYFRELTLMTPLYFVGAFTGSFIMIQFCRKIRSIHLINFIGRNSLICLCVHMYILFVLARFFMITDPYIMMIFVSFYYFQ